MSETTTTADAEVQTAEQSQAEVTAEKTAEATDTQTQTDPKGPDESAEAIAGADKYDWLKNKGIDPADPEALDKVEQKWREAEQGFHQARQDAKGQLREEASTAAEAAQDDPVLARMEVLETRVAVTDFFTAHPEAKELDGDMAEIVKAKPYLAGDLEAVYALAQVGKHEADVKAAETRGREQAKAEIAKASTAGAPHGNAKTQTDKTAEEARLERFSNWN